MARLGTMAAKVRHDVDLDDRKLMAATMNPAIDHVRAINAEIMALAIAKAPRRTTQLAWSHINTGVLRRGPWAAEGGVRNIAPYARYVHEGTEGPITSNRPGGLMKLRPGGGFGTRFAESVDGQRGQPWLVNAAKIVAARHGARVSSVGR